MNVHVLQHASFEGLGGVAPLLAARKAKITTTRFFDSARPPALPPLQGLDLVVAMGGPMSVNNEAELPWLVDEKRFIRDAVQRGTPVLGVCLGSQLIASALGARVYRNAQKEIGWFPVEAVPTSGDGNQFVFPEKLNVFHWHGETFDLPPGAIHLARSAACKHQASRSPHARASVPPRSHTRGGAGLRRPLRRRAPPRTLYPNQGRTPLRPARHLR
jgi:GMP synthase-like glutamine amidotransferase